MQNNFITSYDNLYMTTETTKAVGALNQAVDTYVIVRNPQVRFKFDVVAIAAADDTGRHDVLFYVKEGLEFDDAVSMLNVLTGKSEEVAE